MLLGGARRVPPASEPEGAGLEGEQVLYAAGGLFARVRALGRGSGRKTEDTDAYAVAVVGLRCKDIEPSPRSASSTHPAHLRRLEGHHCSVSVRGLTVPGMAPDRPEGVELLLGVDGELGAMDFPSVMQALQRGYELLSRTAARVIGERALSVRWHLTGMREGSALTVLEASPSEEVTLAELREIAETYALDLEDPAGRLPDEDVAVLRELLDGLEQTHSGSLFTQPSFESRRITVEPAVVLPQLVPTSDRTQFTVIGSVVGTLESITVHAKKEASLYNDFDKRRVVVSFAEADYPRVHAALRKRVEVYGILHEDNAGRPVRIRLQDLEVLPQDEDLPTLRSLVGSMPDLTGDLTPEQYLDRNRSELGFG